MTQKSNCTHCQFEGGEHSLSCPLYKPVAHESDCCQAPVKVVGDSFGEGTNHWECEKCGKPCNDLFYGKPKEEHKEDCAITKALKGLSARTIYCTCQPLPSKEWEEIEAIRSLVLDAQCKGADKDEILSAIDTLSLVVAEKEKEANTCKVCRSHDVVCAKGVELQKAEALQVERQRIDDAVEKLERHDFGERAQNLIYREDVLNIINP